MQTVETLNEGLKRAYTVTITSKDIDARVEKEVKAIAPQVRMPGFRPGKVPANLVKKMHGESLQRDALNNSIQESIQKLIADQKLRPAMQPSVELDENFEFGKDAEVKVALEVLPEIAAPSVEGLKLERLTVAVADEQVAEAAGRIATQQGALEEQADDHEAAEGDTLVIDFVGKVDGEAFEGGSAQDIRLKLGSGQFIPGFEEQLTGVKKGEEKTIDVSFPEDYGAAHLAGKAATFDVTVKSVLDGEKPKLDDDFAKSLGLESLEKLNELLKGQIEQEHNGLTRTHMKRKLLDQLAASHDFDVPPSMVEAEFEQIWAQLQHEAGHEEDPEAALKEMEAEKDDYRAIAVRRVRLGLLLSEIGQANGVTVSDQEMNRLIMQAAQQYGPQDRERFVQYVRQDPMAAAQLRAPLYEDKVVDFLFDKAEITDRAVTREELEAAIEAEDGDLKPHVHGPGCGHDHHDEKPKAKKAAAKKKADEPAEAEAAPAAEEAPAKKPAAKKAAKKDEAVAEEAAAEEKPKKKAAPKKAAAKAE
ncbi:MULTISPECIES: trigger factor [unclassified Sphingobium]|uniref:trigger factor n=1 Tax=unclassified Sphingobium TaxID=2611147 RepID=UPI0007F4C76B|nr:MULTISPECIES: trigger factor [unclassified Sphingobium]OAN56083.1 trigger factor [Sphingobium sp. TCM1]WIW87034.1 trigger factor [Sphingobium sp. V4]